MEAIKTEWEEQKEKKNKGYRRRKTDTCRSSVLIRFRWWERTRTTWSVVWPQSTNMRTSKLGHWCAKFIRPSAPTCHWNSNLSSHTEGYGWIKDIFIIWKHNQRYTWTNIWQLSDNNKIYKPLGSVRDLSTVVPSSLKHGSGWCLSLLYSHTSSTPVNLCTKREESLISRLILCTQFSSIKWIEQKWLLSTLWPSAQVLLEMNLKHKNLRKQSIDIMM